MGSTRAVERLIKKGIPVTPEVEEVLEYRQSVLRNDNEKDLFRKISTILHPFRPEKTAGASSLADVSGGTTNDGDTQPYNDSLWPAGVPFIPAPDSNAINGGSVTAYGSESGVRGGTTNDGDTQPHNDCLWQESVPFTPAPDSNAINGGSVTACGSESGVRGDIVDRMNNLWSRTPLFASKTNTGGFRGAVSHRGGDRVR